VATLAGDTTDGTVRGRPSGNRGAFRAYVMTAFTGVINGAGLE